MGASSVNKGSYFLDSQDRIDAFNAMRAFGNEEAYYAYRANWSRYPETRFVSEYPLSVEFNIANVCNLKCPYCARQTEQFKWQRKADFMDFALFCRVIDEVQYKVPAIRFNCDGEPAMHPRFIDMIKYAKAHGAIEVSNITNLKIIDDAFFEEMMRAGLDWLTVSVDGLYEDYEKNRYPLKFDETYDKLRRFKAMKEKWGSPKPAINVQAVWSLIEAYPEKYYQVMSEVCDAVTYNSFIDFSKLADKNYKPTYDPDFLCSQVYQRLWVGDANGDVYLCCASGAKAVGNINKHTVFDIWHSDEINNIREKLAQPLGFLSVEKCVNCPVPVKLRTSEITIAGRKLIIKNYDY